ncbi:transcriptional regulator GcvA [Rhodovibrionaceae bacterium A322]
MQKTHDRVPLPSLRALKALEATVRLGSFTAAAEELCVTQGAVSRQIQELEQVLEQQLFQRSGPHLSVTETGRQFSRRAAELLDNLERAVREARMHLGKGPVTLSMLPSVATKWFAPRLGRFAAVLPEVDLRIAATRDLVRFSSDGSEAGLRYGRGDWAGLDADLLGRETVSPVCSPALAESLKLSNPQDLLRARLFHSDIEEQWHHWFTAAGCPDVEVPKGPMLGDDTATLQAVSDGQGVALGRSRLIADDLAAGRLVCPFEARLTATFSYWFVTPVGRTLSDDLQAVKAWVKAEFESASG